MSEEASSDEDQQQRIDLLSNLFKVFEFDKYVKEEFDTLDGKNFISELKSQDFALKSSAFNRLSNFTRDAENHARLIEMGVLEPLVEALRMLYTSGRIESGEVEDLAMSVTHSLARLSDEEIYTPNIVAAGAVPVLVGFVLLLDKCTIRKNMARCIYHIAESAFIRNEIVKAVEALNVVKRERFVNGVWLDPIDSEEREYWDEMLQNTDLVLHQYKPGKAWYEPKDFLYCTKLLEDNYEAIKAEALSQCTDNSMVPWPERFLYKDGWNVLGMFAFKNKLEKPCSMCPFTTSILEQIPGLQTALFSTLKPRSHIKPHIGYYQYSEKILRVHMGLVVPEGCIIKVNGEERCWEEGKCIVFDDTFRHEVWNPSETTTRIVLMLDIAFEGNQEDRNPEFFVKSAKQAQFGTDALISKDLIQALERYGSTGENFTLRPEKYL